jgi:hypothetical protein
MGDLNFDQRRADRGLGAGHKVTIGGETHEIPAVLSMETVARFGQVIAAANGGELRIEAEDAQALLTSTPELVGVLAEALGEWVHDLDPEEFMALMELYDLGGTTGKPSAS